MAKALVTGGAGFIGSHLVDALIEGGDDVLVLDNLTTGKRENLNPSSTFVQADVADGEQVEHHLGAFAPDTVFHLAAQADPKRAYREPAFDATVNVRGTINVALAAARAGVDKLVFTSTGGAMYGSPDPDDLPVSEARPPGPASPYGLSKYCAEMYLEMLRRDHGLEYSILRPANVYGPRQDPASEVGVVLIFLELMLAGETPQMRGFGKATRDYVYVKDLVGALLATARSGGPRPYHVGTAEEVDVETIFAGLQERLGSSFDPVRVPLIPGEVERMALDATRAREELNWKPRYSLSEGLDETVSWAVTRQTG